MGEKQTQPVPDEEVTGIDDQLPVNEGVAEATTPTAAGDADWQTKYGELEQRYKQDSAKFQNDLNGLRSSLDRQRAQVESQYQKQVDELRDQLNKIQMETMNEDDKREYERSLLEEKLQQLQQDKASLERKLYESEQVAQFRSMFSQYGLPMDKLVTDQGLDQLVASGWNAILEAFQTSKKELEAIKEGKPSVTAPKPPPRTAGNPASGYTWDEIEKKFGSREAFYRKVETGQLPHSMIPE